MLALQVYGRLKTADLFFELPTLEPLALLTKEVTLFNQLSGWKKRQFEPL
jgi:hypothetical protein